MSTLTAPTPPATRSRAPASWLRAAAGYVGLALLAYVPVFRSSPGRVAADTKQYLYLDPGRMLGRAVTMWDPNIGMGTVTHQNIGYLFPIGSPSASGSARCSSPRPSACCTCCGRSGCAVPGS